VAKDGLPRVVADLPLDETLTGLLAGAVELLPWDHASGGSDLTVSGIYSFGHLAVDGPMMDRFPALRVVSNYGVGVDHIRVDEAAARGVPVGNTPGVLEGATADLAMALLLASARRVVEGDRYARSAAFVRHDPGYMLGREVHHATLGIIGLGNIGLLVARRAIGFEMTVLYHNRRPRPEIEAAFPVTYASLDDLLTRSDYVVLTCPLTDATRGLINSSTLSRMKPTATLINLSRGPVVETAALLDALRSRRIAAAALDVTDPEPLPRDHPLLALDNVVITPHLGSATVETRCKMAELSVANLLAGLEDRPLLHQVLPPGERQGPSR
jgi:glyoxylate reductase